MILFKRVILSQEYHRDQKQNLKNIQLEGVRMIFSCMPNREEYARNLINWFTLLIEAQNYIHSRQPFARSQNLPNRTTLLTKKRQPSSCILKKKTKSWKHFNSKRKNYIAFSYIQETLRLKKRRYLPS